MWLEALLISYLTTGMALSPYLSDVAHEFATPFQDRGTVLGSIAFATYFIGCIFFWPAIAT